MLSGFLLARWNRRPAPKPISTERLEGVDLFETIVVEVHAAALQVAAVASAVNALNPKGASIPRSLLRLIPRVPRIAADTKRCQQELDMPQEVAAIVDAFWKELDRARKLTEFFLADAERSGASQAFGRHRTDLEKTWRALAQYALRAVEALEPQTRWRLAGLYGENSLLLAKLLKAVVRGGQPCLDQRGEIVLPDLPQRRRARRFALMQSCTVFSRGAASGAFATDISATGIGLIDAPSLALRCPIEIKLKNGRRLSGTVVWVKAGKVGVQFDANLPSGDPLLGS